MRQLPPYIRSPRPTAARSLRRIHGISITPKFVADVMIAAFQLAVTVVGCIAAWGVLVIVDRILMIL